MNEWRDAGRYVCPPARRHGACKLRRAKRAQFGAGRAAQRNLAAGQAGGVRTARRHEQEGPHGALRAGRLRGAVGVAHGADILQMADPVGDTQFGEATDTSTGVAGAAV